MMKPMMTVFSTCVIATCFLVGCGQSGSSSKDTSTGSSSPPAPPADANAGSAASPAPAAAPPATTAATDAQNAPAAPPSAADTQASQDPLAAPAAQLASVAATEPDPQAASIGSELASKAKSLAQSAAGNTDLKSRMGSALQSLTAGKDASALGSIFQEVKQANLTPQQTQLVKDMGNLASAYVVQKNFASLDGAKGDVATIVNSLRKGSVAQALPALQSLTQNASLTSHQKELLATLADEYAPGLKKASDSLKQGLQGIQGLTK